MATHFAIFHTYDTPTFKTEALCHVSKKERVKRLLLRYKRQIYVSLPQYSLL